VSGRAGFLANRSGGSPAKATPGLVLLAAQHFLNYFLVFVTPTSSIALPASPPVVNRAKYVAGLALLRGLAALSVGLYHFTGAVLPKLRIDSVQAIFSNGWLGVDVFFVISGFVIPYSLLGKRYSPQKFLPYIGKRIVRINPPAYLAMLLVLAQWYLIDKVLTHKVNYIKDVTLAQIGHNVFFTVPFSEYKWVIGIFWTLAIEFQFYIFIGLLFNLLFEKKSILTFVLVFLALGLVQYLPFQSIENLFHFSALFALGGITLFKQQSRITNTRYVVLLLLFTGVAYAEIGLYEAGIGFLTAVAIQYLSFENAFSRFLGNISYSFYLVHALVGSTCEFLLTKYISTAPVANRLTMLALCLMASIGCAYIFYLLIERPFMKLAGRLRV
jgi:peptidoglycan/LPS O-acetylase OafA/YrhL